MNLGESTTATLTFRNTGDTNWDWTGGTYYTSYALAPISGASTFGAGWLRATSTAPGDECTFTASITAPSTPGTYTLKYRMYRFGQGYFGDTLSKTITVSSPTPNAQAVSNILPDTLNLGESTTATLTFRNTGDTTWDWTDGTYYTSYALAPISGGSTFGAGWLRATSTAPGEECTFTASITAPSIPGTYTLKYRMYRFGQGYFGDTLSKTITVSSPTANSQVISDTLPNTMNLGESTTATLTFRNTGDTTWDWTDGTYYTSYALAPISGGSTFGAGWLRAISTAPGDECTFTASITAPSTPGTYTLKYRMYRFGQGYFGDTLSKTITVSSPLPNAQAVSNSLLDTMNLGESTTATLTFRNTGDTTWDWTGGTYYTSYALAPISGGSSFGAGWLRASTTAPGEECTFTASITAPSTPGSYILKYRMYRFGQGYFGDTLSKTITVSSPIANSQVVSNTLPDTMNLGESTTATLTFRNTGDTTWDWTDGTHYTSYALAPISGASSFGAGWLRASTTAPGEECTFTASITAPSTPGTYTLKYRMYRFGQGYFGDTLSKTINI